MTDDFASDTPEAKKALFRRLLEIYEEADVDALDTIIAPHYAGHTSAGDRDLTEFRQNILNFNAIFEYGKGAFIVEDQFVEGDKLATRMTANVRLRETGEPVTMLGINLAIIKGGKLIEEWNTWEQFQAPQSLSTMGAS